MTNLDIAASEKTPHICASAQSGRIEITGRSIPENSLGFYEIVFEWIKKYSQSPAPLTEMIIELDYFNTSSSKCILDVFRLIESIGNAGHKCQIKWIYETEDEDMMEAGEDYREILNVPFEIVEKK